MPVTPRRPEAARIWLRGTLADAPELLATGAAGHNLPQLRFRLHVALLAKGRAPLIVACAVWDAALVGGLLNLDAGASLEVEGRPTVSAWTTRGGDVRPGLSVSVDTVLLPGETSDRPSGKGTSHAKGL